MVLINLFHYKIFVGQPQFLFIALLSVRQDFTHCPEAFFMVDLIDKAAGSAVEKVIPKGWDER